MAMSEAARKARNAYMREYRKKNREAYNEYMREWKSRPENKHKQQLYQKRYWERKAEEMQQVKEG